MRRGPGRRKPNAADRGAALQRAERRAKAYRFAVQGLTLRDIGAQLGISHEQARKDLRQGIAELGQQTREEQRAISNGALAAVLEGNVELARRGDPKASRVVVAAVATGARLNGLESPKLVELTGKDGAPLEAKFTHENLLSRLARLADAAGAGEGDPEPESEGD